MGEHDPALSPRFVEPGKLELPGLVRRRESSTREGEAMKQTRQKLAAYWTGVHTSLRSVTEMTCRLSSLGTTMFNAIVREVRFPGMRTRLASVLL